ncbi:MAG: zinc ribbon domain-containing protein [Candidatus Bathyarchaeales archaeon]
MTENRPSSSQSHKNQCPSCGASVQRNAKKCPKCQADIQEKTILIPKPTVATDEFLAEEIWNRKDPPQYLIYHYSTGKVEQATQIDLCEVDGKGRKIIYTPVDNEALRKGLVLLPSGVTETTFKQVFSEIDEYAQRAYDSCGRDAMIRLLTRITVASWFLDRFITDPQYDVAGAGKFAPIIAIRGPSQSGKNRLAFLLRTLSYRPYFEMSTHRIPSLYRPLDLWQGTLVLDEADFANTNEKSELVHFLNCRATGTPLGRQNPKNPRITDTFTNFGLTILTQRKPFDDNATESRALPFYSEASDKRLPVIETDEMLKEGLSFQNKLLYLRMRYHQEITIKKDSWIEELIDHRLIASLLPLLALSRYEPTLKETITETARAVQKLKIEEKTNSMDGLLVNYFWEKINEGLFKHWQSNTYYFLETADAEGQDQNERLECKPLTTSDLALHFKWSSQSIRKAIKSLNIASTGLPPFIKDGGKSYRVIFFEPERLEKRLKEFIVDYAPKSVFQTQSLLGDKLVTEVTGVTVFTCDEENTTAATQRREEDNIGGRDFSSSQSSNFTVQENRDLRDSRDPAAQPKPLFVYWQDTSSDCSSCTKKAGYKVVTPQGDVLNKCPSCFEAIKRTFAVAEWREHHD